MNLSVLKSEIVRMRSEQSLTWLVINSRIPAVYYEAVDEVDARRNCPPGHHVVHVTEDEMKALFNC